jgi:hypothetical protein
MSNFKLGVIILTVVALIFGMLLLIYLDHRIRARYKEKQDKLHQHWVDAAVVVQAGREAFVQGTKSDETPATIMGKLGYITKLPRINFRSFPKSEWTDTEWVMYFRDEERYRRSVRHPKKKQRVKVRGKPKPPLKRRNFKEVPW